MQSLPHKRRRYWSAGATFSATHRIHSPPQFTVLTFSPDGDSAEPEGRAIMRGISTFVVCCLLILSAFVNASAQDLMNGLEAWYPLDGNALEFTERARHGTVYNDVTPTTDRFDQADGAMHFSGNKSWIDVPPVDLSGDAMSLSVFVNPTDISSQTWYNAVRQDGEGLPDFLIQFAASGKEIDFGLWAGGRYFPELRVNINPADFVGKWRLLTATYDGAMMRLYIDAELAGEQPRTGKVRFAPRKSNIGRMTGKEYFKGGLDDVRYYSRALTPDDMRAIMQSRTATPVGDAVVSGTVFNDRDGDCLIGDFDDKLRHRLVRIMPGEMYALSDAEGKWSVNLPAGDYSAELLEAEHWRNECPNNSGIIEFRVNSGDEAVPGLDFGQHAAGPRTDLDVSLGGLAVRPGWETTYKIYYRNTGTEAFNGWLHFQHDQWFEFIRSNPEADIVDGNHYAWRIDDLAVGAAAVIEIRLRHLPDAPLGELVCNSAWAVPDRGRELLSAMYDEYCHEVRGSYDPNDIAVHPGREIAEVDTDLSYLIRFQNTGTAPAAKIVVKQQLPEELDLNTFRQGAVSHDYEFFVDVNRMATWTFDDIELPDNKSDELGSQGYIKYKLQLRDNTPVNVPVGAKAEIYFDFNDAVITNTAEVELVNTVTSVADESPSAGLCFGVDRVGFITIDNPGAREIALALFDSFGRLVQHVNPTSYAQVRMDARQLCNGVYFLRVTSSGRSAVEQIVLQR